MTLTIAHIAWFLWYPILVWRKWGVLSSISASSYKWKGNKKAWFISWLVGLAVLSFWLDMGIYSHIMAVGFTISGMSVDHKRRKGSVEDEYHTIGTLLAMASGFVGLYFLYGVWIPTAVFIAISSVLFVMKRNWIWWVECLAAAAILTGYMIA